MSQKCDSWDIGNSNTDQSSANSVHRQIGSLTPESVSFGEGSSRPPDSSRRLGWIRLGYGEMTEEFRVPSDHLESLNFGPISIEISLVLMMQHLCVEF